MVQHGCRGDHFHRARNVDTILDQVLRPGSFRGITNTPPMISPGKLVFSLLLGAASVGTLQAQELRLGGGYSGSKVDADGSDNWKGRAGYQYGICLLYTSPSPRD